MNLSKLINLRILYYYLSGLLIIMGFSSVVSLLNLSRAIDRILEENFISVKASNHMLISISNIHRYLFFQKKTIKNNIENLIEKDIKIFDNNLTLAENNITIFHEKDFLSNIRKDFSNYKYELNLILSESENIDLQKINDLFKNITSEIKKLRNLNEKAIIKANEEAKHLGRKRSIWLIFLSIIALLSAFYLNGFINDKYLKPISEINTTLKRVINGNLDLRFNNIHQTVFSDLGLNINKMIDKLSEFKYEKEDIIVFQQNYILGLLENIQKPAIIFDLKFNPIFFNKIAEKQFFDENDVFSKILLQQISSGKTEFQKKINNTEYTLFIKEMTTSSNKKVGWFVTTSG